VPKAHGKNLAPYVLGPGRWTSRLDKSSHHSPFVHPLSFPAFRYRPSVRPSISMWQLGVPPLELVLRTVLVYVLFLAALRVFGKREIGQFTLFDLTLVLLAANALQPAITGSDASIPGAVIIVVTIFTVNRLVAELRRRNPVARRLLEFPATVVGKDGRWIPEALDKEGLDDDDLEQALREHGLDSTKDVKVAVLEQDGSISIVPKVAPSFHMRAAHRRYRRQPQR